MLVERNPINMAIHSSAASMVKESLNEMILVADYCFGYRKDPLVWKSQGCYGFPAALLLLSVIDSIGFVILKGSVRKHFDILNHQDYYNLGLSKESIDIIYKNYRCMLSHNSRIAPGYWLDIGNKESSVFEFTKKGEPCLYLVPFLCLSKKVVEVFLDAIKSNKISVEC